MRLLGIEESWPPETGGDELVMAATRDELAALAGAIGEALEAIEDWEFDTRLGVNARGRESAARQDRRRTPGCFPSRVNHPRRRPARRRAEVSGL